MTANKKMIAFTFDDVPSYEDIGDNPTTTISNVLKEFGGKGTFFLIGSNLRKNGRKLVDKILFDSFEIANHTDTHPNLANLSPEEIESEILTLQNTVIQQFGINMKYMRPPGLRANANLFAVTKELNMPAIYGNHGIGNLNDWKIDTPPEFVKSRCLDNVYPGQIIIMHGYSLSTQAAFYEICESLAKDGYMFVTLSELFDGYGVKEIPCDRPITDALLTKI